MSETIEEFHGPIGPDAAHIFNVAVTTSSAAIDLTGAGYEGLNAAIGAGRLLELIPSANVWYRWATATGTVDETKTAADTPANQGVLHPSGVGRPQRPPNGTAFLIIKGASNCTLFMWVRSRSINSDMQMG